MKWTKEKPTVSGFYWSNWSTGSGSTPETFDMFYVDVEERYIEYCRTDWGYDLDEQENVSWMGPIPEPEDIP